ncbi:winged helix-turn-helix domain-containing protein [Candidatus Marsarchaeota archaeon]|nr:winged helix-turn-helix domain-containing protein [Candidatus Marsarchaeota archaeon]
MSKQFSTKRKIINLLAEKSMTRAQLAKELELAPSTVSQHLDELEMEGAIFQDGRSKSKKWKYYRAYGSREQYMQQVGKEYHPTIIIGALAVVAVAAIILLSIGMRPTAYTPAKVIITSTTTPTAVNSQVSITPSASMAACPVIFNNQTFESEIVGYSNMTLYNDSGTPEYIIAPGTTGSMEVALSKPSASSNIRISNLAAFYYQLDGSNEYAANSTDGVAVVFNKSSEYLTSSAQNATVMVSIAVSKNAQQGTYTVFIPEGPCKPSAQVFLLTVGTKPYTGKINAITVM